MELGKVIQLATKYGPHEDGPLGALLSEPYRNASDASFNMDVLVKGKQCDEDFRKLEIRKVLRKRKSINAKRRRAQLKELVRTLQELVPNCNKNDINSVLEDAIKYLKELRLQVKKLTQFKYNLYDMQSAVPSPQFPTFAARQTSTMAGPPWFSCAPAHSMLPFSPFNIPCIRHTVSSEALSSWFFPDPRANGPLFGSNVSSVSLSRNSSEGQMFCRKSEGESSHN